jgi:hypothetical protein
MPTDYYFDVGKADWRMSRQTRLMLNAVNSRSVIQHRRASFLSLLESARSLAGAEPLFDRLPPGVCPLVFPLVVIARDHWIRELWRRGIDAIPWWAGYHRAMDWSEFAEARHLKDSIVALPVHQGLGPAQIHRIVIALLDIARSQSGR